jgi:hypothetical protein
MLVFCQLRAASQNLLSLASDQTFRAEFGITEHRRMLIAGQCLTDAGNALQGFVGGA